MEIQFNKACGCSVPGTTGDSAGLGFAEENAKYCMSLLDQPQNGGRHLKERSLQASNQDRGTGRHVGEGNGCESICKLGDLEQVICLSEPQFLPA